MEYKVKQLNLAIISALLTASVTAHAGQARFTESLAGAVKCSKVDGESICALENKGKYSATAYISAETFEEKGITFDMLNDGTSVEIHIGNFEFYTTLGDAVKRTLTPSKLNAKWQNTHDVANKKPAVDTTVTVSANSNAVTIKVTGTNKFSDNESFGQTFFAGYCKDHGNGASISEPVTLTVDGILFSALLTGECKVKIKTVEKQRESFELFSISSKGVAGYMD